MENPTGFQLILSLILFAVIGTATAFFAEKRGRDPMVWFLVGMLLGIIGLILLFFLPSVRKESSESEISKKEKADSAGPMMEEFVPPPQPALDSLQWFYLDYEHQQYGPIAFEELKSKALSGEITRETYLWHEGMDNWQRFEEIEGLKNLV